MDYLRPRLFEPLDFGPIAWEKCPAGIEKGGWGLYAMPEDLAKMGQLYLNRGYWACGGVQRALLPEAWVDEVSRVQAEDNKGSYYGYQLWVDAESGNYVMNGMFGQYVTVMPALDMVVVMTAGCPRIFTDAPAYALMKKHFFALEALPNSLPPNPVSLTSLNRTVQALRFRHPVPEGPRQPERKLSASRKARWNGRPLSLPAFPAELQSFLGTSWHFPQNRAGILPLILQAMDNNFSAGIRTLRLDAQNNELVLYWEEDQDVFCLPIGFGVPVEGTLRIGKESFLTSCRAEIRPNDELEPVLRIEVCLLEHSSFRLLKLQRKDDDLLLRLDEHPQIRAALEMAMERKADSFPEFRGENTALGGIIRNNEFFHFRIAQLCTPELIGTASNDE